MAEPLKTFFSAALVRRLAADIARVDSGFRSRAFSKQARTGLDGLELLDRARHISRALGEHLPKDFPVAIETVLRSLGPELATDELLGVGMAPFYYLPHLLLVAERGLDHFDLAMRAQYELTKRCSAESSIRAFIAKDPDRAFSFLRTWATDSNPHVRRLVSEGTRLRLPWAMRVAWLDAHPGRVLELLDLLKDDPTTLVRRSVANNLNDLGKVHRDELVRTCERWIADETSERRTLVEHALRSAVKRGDPEALRVLGYGHEPTVAIEQLEIAPKRVAVGGSVEIRFALRNTGRSDQGLLVDLAVHFVKANGRTTPKTFKLDRVTLAAGQVTTFAASISLAVHTTRKPQRGTHGVDVLVNGRPNRAGSFEVIAPRRPRR